MRKPIVGVMGGADASAEVCSQARQLGTLIARRGWVLLTGGRGTGVMGACAQGARQANGTVLGILPGRDAGDLSPDVDIAVVTGLGDARNLINVLSSDVIIACQGGAGTLSEVALAVKNRKRVVLLGLDPGPALDTYGEAGLLTRADSPADAVDQAASVLDTSSRR